MRTLQQCQDRLAAIRARVAALNGGEAPSSATEVSELDAETTALLGEIEQLTTQASNLAALNARMATLDNPSPRATAPATPGARVTGGDAPGASRSTGGFSTQGHFAQAVISAIANRGQPVDGRLLALGGGNTQVGAEGGFAVPPAFAQQILVLMQGEESLAQRCTQLSTSGGDFEQVLNKDEPWNAAGVQVDYWPELSAKTAQKPNVDDLTIKTEEAGALVKLSSRIMSDAAQITSLVLSQVPLRLMQWTNKQIMVGDGVGRHFLGILGSPARVVLTAEGGQGANIIVWKNVRKMFRKVPQWRRTSAVWLVAPDAIDQLDGLKDDSGRALYIPGGTVAGQPFDTLYGRPVFESEWCKALGTEGDIVFADFGSYGYLTVAGQNGVAVEQSMHLYFDQNAQALRFVQRAGGRPLWPAPGTHVNGGQFSPFVVLNSTRT